MSELRATLELKTLLQNATPGPWRAESYGVSCPDDTVAKDYCISHADAALIAAAVNALPALLDALEQQAAALREAERALQPLAAMADVAERSYGRSKSGEFYRLDDHTLTVEDTQRARAALRAVEALAVEWEREADRYRESADRFSAAGKVGSSGYAMGLMSGTRSCAREIRDALGRDGSAE